MPDRVPSPPGRWFSRLVEGDTAQPIASGGSFVMAAGGHSCQGGVVVHPVLATSTCELPPIGSPNDSNLFPGGVLVGNFPAGKYRVLREPGRARAELCYLRVGDAMHM